MSAPRLSARGLLSLLWNGEKAIDVVKASLEIGLLGELDAGARTVGELAERLGVVPLRLYKLLDCLETLGFVERTHEGETLGAITYRAVEPLRAAALAVVGPESQERDRDRHPWRSLLGNLPAVLRGERGIPDDVFPWPPTSEAQLQSFEASMSAGAPPIAESFLSHASTALAPVAREDGCRPGLPRLRMLDVGGGDGTLARRLLLSDPALHVDVYNLPALRPLVERTMGLEGTKGRLGFVPGDFLAEPLPSGYDALSFVRVLHDWPNDVAVTLIRKAYDALPGGGRIVISEEFRDAERLAVQFFWSYFLLGIDACVSRLRESAFYVRALGEAGFVGCQVLPGAFDIVVATKPRTSAAGSPP